MTISKSTKKPVPVALALGVLGGAALIMTTELTARGPAIYIPYAVLVIAIFITLRLINWTAFYRRFAASFLAFMTATIILGIFITVVKEDNFFKIPFWWHISVLAFMSAISGILGLAVAYLADIGKK